MSMTVNHNLFVNKPSSHLYCPLCDDILRDPVISVVCGHTFCRQCLVENGNTVAKIATCPVDEREIKGSSVVDNRAILSQIEDLKVYCRYGMKRLNSQNDVVQVDNGCPEILSFLESDSHHCQFEVINCPNSDTCGRFQKKELADHISFRCKYVSCKNRSEGCNFTGTKVKVRSHEEKCSLNLNPEVIGSIQRENKDLKNLITILNDKMQVLTKSNNDLTHMMKEQAKEMSSLEERFQALAAQVETNSKRMSNSFRTRLGSGSLSLGRSRRLSFSSDTNLLRHEEWQVPFEFKCIGTLSGHKGSVRCLAIHEHKLYSGGDDQVIKVWDLEALSKGCVQELRGHKDFVNALLASSDFLYSAGMDRTIRMWKYDVSNTEHNCRKNAHEQNICALAKAGPYLFSSSHSEFKVWNAENLEILTTITGLHHWVRAITLDPKKERLYCGSHNAVTVWDATGHFNMKRKLDHTYGSVYSMVVSHEYLIIGTHNRNIQIFNVENYHHVKKLDTHVGVVTNLLLSPDKQFLLSSCFDNTVMIFNLENFLSLQVLSRHQGSVNAMALRNGLLFSGSEDKEIKIFKYFRLTTYSSYGIHIRPGQDT